MKILVVFFLVGLLVASFRVFYVLGKRKGAAEGRSQILHEDLKRTGVATRHERLVSVIGNPTSALSQWPHP